MHDPSESPSKTAQIHQSIKKPVHWGSLYPILPSEFRSRQPFLRWHHGTLLSFVGTCGPLVECFQGVRLPLCPMWFCLSRHECFVNAFYIVFWLYQNQNGSFTRTVLFFILCLCVTWAVLLQIRSSTRGGKRRSMALNCFHFPTNRWKKPYRSWFEPIVPYLPELFSTL